jgi:2',3'-cyclic-nucleotide 2'-phosphodiesterase (5'-nucleotidase family)
MTKHPTNCNCGCNEPLSQEGISRKEFLKTIGTAGIGLGIAPISSMALWEDGKTEEILKSKLIESGKVQHISLLHTTDLHGQLHVHDEFFVEKDQVVFKKRGGFAHLKTLISELRMQNPNSLLIDGGDCFQGSGVASLSEGKALIPLMNLLNYDLVLPGNWEVAYGKQMLLHDLGGYNARKVCTNMFHDVTNPEFLFPPYQIFYIAGVKMGFIGYNDPLTPTRQPPAYSYGIKFIKPEINISKYIKILRDQENCKLIFVLTHMGLTQQIHLASQEYTEGVHYILGADTHERIRQPLQAKYAKVTEPGAFGSFLGKLDLILEDGILKEESYQLIDVDPEKYKADEEMEAMIQEVSKPYQQKLNRVIGKTKTPLIRYYILETPMDNMITDALMWKFNPDIAVSNGFRFCPPLNPDASGTANITVNFLYCMLPSNNNLIIAEVSGQQILDWLEKELENVFASDPAKRFGGWLVRFQGMKINFTIAREYGKRVNEILIKGKKIDLKKNYQIVSCEREGDPKNLICRIKNVNKITRLPNLIHDVMEDYLAKHSPVSPKLEGRATATDAPANLLTQANGLNYEFR